MQMHELEALVTIFMALTNYTEVLCLNLKVSKTSAILEKAIPVILFSNETKELPQLIKPQLPNCLFVESDMHVYLLLLPEEFLNFLDLLIPYSTFSFNVNSGTKKNNNNNNKSKT